MTQPSLKPIRLRMERASEHGTELQAGITEFLQTNPYDVVRKFDPNPPREDFPPTMPRVGAHRYRAFIKEEVPDRISILAGDVAKDLRSALDYVAWQLALARSDDPPQTTAFPIFRDPDLYARDHPRFIGAIDPAFHPTFEAVQPYHAGDQADDHALWVLHRLANDDKHRTPHVVGSMAVGLLAQPPKAADDVWVGTIYGPFDDGAVIANVMLASGVDPKTDPNFSATFDIAFGKDTPAKGRPLYAEIDRIGREVEAVVNRFIPPLA